MSFQQEDWHGNLRVRYDSPASVESTTESAPVRSAPQAHTDHALDQAEKAALEALRLTTEAVEWLGTVTQVKNRDAAHYVKKLFEEIVEVRRVRG
jgi:hypothetical protein